MDSNVAAVVYGIADPEGNGIGRAHVRASHDLSTCAGTLIAPDWYITSLHCVGNSAAGTWVYVDGNDEPASWFSANVCHGKPFPAHPVLNGCNSADLNRPIDRRSIPAEHDLALLHLETPVLGVPFRSIEPIRGCRPESEFPCAFRGEGRGGTDIGTGLRHSTFAAGTCKGFDFHPEMSATLSSIDPETGETARAQAGDSGGGFTHAEDDESGPIVAVASELQVVSPSIVKGSFIWEPENIAWIWSTLDPTGACTINSGRPCVFREPTPDGGDVCGDQHCTGDETATSCPGECFAALPDADGDGLPDMRDLCPYLDARLVAADRIVDGNHIDADQNRMGDDCTPASCADVCSADVDRDSIPDDCDICPGDFDPEQLDTDGDGSDNCPGTPNDDQDDTDGDGIGDRCDNCPGIPNVLQTNCNVDAELAFPDPEQPQGHGDLCDPTPCGDTLMGAVVRDETIDGRPARVLRMDRLRVDGVASEEFVGTAGFRFCRCPSADADTFMTREACAEEDAAALGECVVGRIVEYEDLNEDRRWRDTSVDLRSEPSVRLPGDLTGRHQEAVLTYEPVDDLFTPDVDLTWDSRIDTARWSRVAAEEQAMVDAGTLDLNERRFPNEETAFPIDQALPGVLWTHSPRAAVEDFSAPGGYVAGPAFEGDERRRASHYWSGSIAPPTVALQPFPCLSHIGSLRSSACPLCAPVFPRGFLARSGVIVDGSCGREPVPTPPLLALPELAVDLRDQLEQVFDPGPLLIPGLRWLTPAEPEEWLTPFALSVGPSPVRSVNASSDIRLISVDETTGFAKDILVQGPFGLVPTGFDPQLPPNPCDNPNGCGDVIDPPFQQNALRAGDSSSDENSSVLGADPTFVFSARRQQLWQIGDGQVRVQSLTANQIREVPVVVEKLRGDVLAATYRPDDDALYVLVERHRRHHRHWRHAHHRRHRRFRGHRVQLVRIALDEAGRPVGQGQVVGRWRRRSLNTRYVLTAGAGGGLWLAASRDATSGQTGQHVVFRLELRTNRRWHGHRPARWQATGWMAGEGVLTDVPAAADRRGLSMVVQANGLEQTVGVELGDLWPARRFIRRCL